ncbi:SPOR domain-containing protein [Hyphobacterium sp.]|uniref:SPOR domain-containing protein n=1 Tax=Hyphobacterium sp. TaxID=2004662 RepID=UPI003BABFDF5
MIRFAILFTLPFVLSACMSTRSEPGAPVAEAAPIARTASAGLAAQLAADLDWRSRYDPATLDQVEEDMRRLALRLAAPPEPAPEPEPLAADPEGGQSLMHAIHLASYRNEQNARSGWQSLQALFPDLMLDRQARLEEADLGSRGVFLRLKAGPFLTGAEAEAACAQVVAAGGWCDVTDFTGRPMDP